MKMLFSKKHLRFLNFNFEIVLVWRTVSAAALARRVQKRHSVQRCFLLQEKHGVLEKIKQEPQKGEVTQDHFTFLRLSVIQNDSGW